MSPVSSANITSAGPISPTPNNASPSAPAGIAARRFDGTFSEAHILAITQAICDYRRAHGIDGPLYMGKDTHALSGPAQHTALEVLAANGVRHHHSAGRRRHADAGYLARHSRLQPRAHGAPGRRHRRSRRRTIRRRTADSSTTRPTAARPTPMSRNGSRTGPTNCCAETTRGVKRVPFASAIAAPTTRQDDFVPPLCPRSAERRRHGRDSRRRPQAGRRSAGRRLRTVLGADQRRLWTGHCCRQPEDRSDLLVHDGRSRRHDPHGLLQPLRDGRLVGLKDKYRVAFGNDPDSDRHGIVTPSAGLMNPNHYLAVAIRYLLTHRPRWPEQRRGRQDAGEQQHDRPRGQEAGPPAVRGAGRIQVVRSGPRSTARAALAARRAPARASCGATARCGPPTRTA